MDKLEVVNEIPHREINKIPIAEGYKRPVNYRTNPQLINELKGLAEEHGGLLKPIAVVDAARDVKSPLHDIFEWDDTEAGERYRLIQARMLLTVTVEYLPIEKKVMPQKVFVSLSSDRVNRSGGGYRTMVSVMSDQEKRQELVQNALEEMGHFEARYKNLKEMKDVIDAMREVKKAITH